MSGRIDPDIKAKIARGEAPKADYVAMAEAFPADLIDYVTAQNVGGRIGRLLARVGGPNLQLAWSCYRKRGEYEVIFTDGEQVGIPLALLFKFLPAGNRPRHIMIGHWLSVRKKMFFFDYLGVQNDIDTIFVYSSTQKQYAESRWQLPPGTVVATPFMVDDRFFSPAEVLETSKVQRFVDESRPVICAVGLEFRDYPTLMNAIRDMDLLVVIAAASPWSKRSDSTAGSAIPDNVIVERFSQYELRQLYSISRFTVMPLHNVDFQAGVTAILEAMAMKKAVICTRTAGQTDVVIEGITGLYVAPQDPQALGMAIQYLLDNPQLTRQMGENGRRLVEEKLNLDHYVARLKRHLEVEEVQYKITGTEVPRE